MAKKGKHGVLSKSAQGFPTSIYVVVKLFKKAGCGDQQQIYYITCFDVKNASNYSHCISFSAQFFFFVSAS